MQSLFWTYETTRQSDQTANRQARETQRKKAATKIQAIVRRWIVQRRMLPVMMLSQHKNYYWTFFREWSGKVPVEAQPIKVPMRFVRPAKLIQCAWRVHHARKKAEETKAYQLRVQRAQAIARRWLSRTIWQQEHQSRRQAKHTHVIEEVRRDAAALRIQAVWRSCIAKRRTGYMRQWRDALVLEQRERNAATLIQKHVRRYLVERWLYRMLLEQRAAVNYPHASPVAMNMAAAGGTSASAKHEVREVFVPHPPRHRRDSASSLSSGRKDYFQ